MSIVIKYSLRLKLWIGYVNPWIDELFEVYYKTILFLFYVLKKLETMLFKKNKKQSIKWISRDQSSCELTY
jgi:hypothetical protein